MSTAAENKRQLSNAIKRNNLLLVEQIISTNPNLRVNAISSACKIGNIEMMKLLIKQYQIDHRCHKKLVILAIKRAKIEMLKFLITKIHSSYSPKKLWAFALDYSCYRKSYSALQEIAIHVDISDNLFKYISNTISTHPRITEILIQKRAPDLANYLCTNSVYVTENNRFYKKMVTKTDSLGALIFELIPMEKLCSSFPIWQFFSREYFTDFTIVERAVLDIINEEDCIITEFILAINSSNIELVNFLDEHYQPLLHYHSDILPGLSLRFLRSPEINSYLIGLIKNPEYKEIWKIYLCGQTHFDIKYLAQIPNFFQLVESYVGEVELTVEFIKKITLLSSGIFDYFSERILRICTIEECYCYSTLLVKHLINNYSVNMMAVAEMIHIKVPLLSSNPCSEIGVTESTSPLVDFVKGRYPYYISDDIFVVKTYHQLKGFRVQDEVYFYQTCLRINEIPPWIIEIVDSIKINRPKAAR